MSSKQFVNINNKYDRVIVLVDMDCFYCQVEEKISPEIRGKPIAVVQYNPWQGGGIIAVNYPARAKGVTRHMRGDEARQHCPDIILPQVPQVRGKADISKYRDAGKEVAAVLQTFTPLLERASVDEAYLDITERVLARLRDMNEGKFQLLPDKLANTFAVGYESVGEFVQKISGDLDRKDGSQELDTEEDRVAYKKSDIKLLIGASIVNEIRAAVKDKTGYECSAGIAHNKILAKLTAGFHKPNKQTILPLKSISNMYQTLQIKKVKGLGGKLGEQVCEILKIQFMAEMANFTEKALQNHFEERMGSWMYLMARGIDLEAVTPKFNSKSIGCCKRFPGKNAISGLATLTHWLGELANEIQERLEKDMDENNRTARQMTVSYAQQIGESDVSSTRSVPISVYEAPKIAADALDAIKRNTEVFLKPESAGALNNPIKFLGISAGKFEDNSGAKKSGLKEMFSNIANKAGQGEFSKDIKKDAEASVKKPVDKKGIKSFFQKCADQTDDLSGKRLNGTNDDNIPDKPPSAAIINTDSTIKSCVETPLDNKPLIKDALQLSDSATDANNDQTTSFEPSFEEERSSDNYLNSTLPFDDALAIQEVNQDVFSPKPSSSGINTFTKSDQNQSHFSLGAESSELGLKRSGSLEIKTVESINEEVITSLSQAEHVEQPTDNANGGYLQTYAEFYRPQVIPKPTQKPCPECGKSVLESELQSHLDFHLALQLSQQQREQFRTAVKSKFSSPAAKQKAAMPTTKKVIAPQISKFLTTVNTPCASSDGAFDRCDECRKMIPGANMQEHLDYHAARKLQLELNQREMQTVVLNGFNTNKTGNGANGLKRKRTPGSDKSHPVKVNSLSSYLTKL